MTTAIILLGGSSTRMQGSINKAYMNLFNKQVITYSIDAFLKVEEISQIILVYNKLDINHLKKVLELYPDEDIKIIEGGTTRHESVNKALEFVETPYVLVHDAARPYIKPQDIRSVINALKTSDAVTLYHPVVDQIKWNGRTIPKTELKAVTTPQGFNEATRNYILNNPDYLAADELEIIENKNFKISYVLESSPNPKITYKEDLENLNLRVGLSIDFHPFVEKDYLVLGGVKIPSSFGLKGHSDADALYHSVCESIYGALALGDMGTNFPDNDPKYLGMDSRYFLKQAKQELVSHGYEIANIDIMILLEKPKLKEYKTLMQKNVAENLGIDSDKVSVKATTYELMGPVGQSEGIQVESIVLIKKISL